MRTILPDGQETKTRAPGYTIRRDRFDQSLAKEAERNGAEIKLSTRALAKSNGEILLKEGNGRLSKVKAKVVIGADGPHSTVGRWIGSMNRTMISAIQVRVPLVDTMNYTEVYFDKNFYGGYGWLFPKGDEANVGVGMKKNGVRTPSMKQALDRFLFMLREEGKIKGEPRAMTAGWVPVEPSEMSVHENVLLVGDAAGQTHPITGAGVAQAVICGRKAGKWAVRSLEKGDLKLLSEYERDWREHFGETLERASMRRRKLEREWGKLEDILKTCWVAYKEYYA
jgi:flavin-dependent dehydrogenase